MWRHSEATSVRTADMFLFGRGFIWVCSFLNVYNQLALRLVLVHRSLLLSPQLPLPCRKVQLVLSLERYGLLNIFEEAGGNWYIVR